MQTIDVAAAIIRDGEKFLICQRPKGKNCELLWEFPGGKIEPGETAEQCIVRECREELGVTVRLLGKFGEAAYDYPDRRVRIAFFDARVFSGVPVNKEHNDMRWVTYKQVRDFEFCPADEKIVGRIASMGASEP